MRRVAPSPDRIGLLWGLLLAVLLGAIAATPVPAQPDEPAPEPTRPAPRTTVLEEVKPLATPRFDIDLFAFLSTKEAQSDAAADSVWTIKPGPGKRLLQLPLILEASRNETELDSSTFKVKGGRFLVFKLLDEGADKASAGSDAAREIEENLPTGAPRITRRITVTPRGKIKWSMDRNLRSFGGELKADQLYSYKIESAMLTKKAPPDPVKVTKNTGESQRDFLARKSTEDAKYRAAFSDYRDLQKEVRLLPDNFEAPMPARVWAVFEVGGDSMDLSGPEPLPWSLTFEQLQSLRDGMTPVQPESNQSGPPRLPRAAVERIALMTSMITTDRHPYTARAISFVLSESRMVPYAETGDSLYKLMDLVIKSSDSVARQVMIKELARTVPPTSASIALSTMALKDMDTSTQMIYLNSLIKGDARDRGTSPAATGESGRAAAAQVQQMIAQVNNLLAAPKGPPPREVIDLLVEHAKARPESADLIVDRVRFEDMPPDRLDDAIVAVVSNAPTHPVAAGWLDKKLLGSADPKLTRRTLEVINNAGSGGAGAVAGITPGELILNLAFGTGRNASSGPSGARLDEPLRITSTSHSLFRALQHGNPEIRSLAWNALSRFSLEDKPALNPGAPPNPSTPRPAEDGATPSQALLTAALALNPTPVQVVDVLARQKDTAAATDSIVTLIVRGGNDASRQATRVLLRSKNNWPVDKSLMALSYAERQAFAARVYENITGKAPLVVGLMRQKLESNPLVEWFGKELAAGKTPGTGEWAAHAGGEEKVLELITSSDPELARGAMASLVAEAGGDDRQVLPLTQKLSQLPDTTLANLKTQWAAARRDIYALRLSRADGPYTLIVRVANQGGGGTPGLTPGMPGAMPGPGGVPPGRMPPGMTPPTPATPGTANANEKTHSGIADATEIELGLVQLQADGQSVKLANQALTLSVPSDKMAIRVDKPAELKNFNDPQLAKLAVDQVTTPVDLLPQQDGSWRGTFTLPPDGKAAEIVLAPASEEYRQ